MDNTWYCDSHAHYDQRRFRDDQAALLGAMENHQIRLIVNVGCDLPSSLASIALSERYDFIYASVGSHPDDADHVDEGLISLYRQLSQKEKVVAIGEIGLDYHYEDVPRAVQQRAFRMQLALARELKRPVIVHEREAHGDAMEILEDFPDVTGVFHCYSGSLEMARELIFLQGIVDCAFEENGGLVIVDYKTDRVRDARTLLEHYSGQMNVYRRAMELCKGLPVRACILYSFALGEAIYVEP